jgi:hypothetical protein
MISNGNLLVIRNYGVNRNPAQRDGGVKECQELVLVSGPSGM